MPGEDSPLLTAYPSPNQRLRRSTTLLVVVILLAACTYIGIRGEVKWWIPKDPQERADYYLSESPVIDGHIDLPELIREEYGNDLDRVDLEKKTVSEFPIYRGQTSPLLTLGDDHVTHVTQPGDVDIPRIRKGHLGGFFFSAFVDCPPTTPSNSSDSDDFHAPTNAVRDTLEQIDLARLIITERYPDVFAFTKTAVQVEEALAEGKVAGLIGIEGAHQLGNSLAVLRTYYQLGVRYMTLTHGCNNVFADSGGIFSPVPPAHGGLSKIGRDLIGEMNRIGMMIDLSHVSDQTAEQALDLTEAPVMWSHSASRTFNNISRNVPDYLLERIGTGNRAKENGKKDAVVMVNFYPEFLLPRGKDAHGRVANVKTVADHVEHIARIAGKSQ